jgi:hypothetical protein
MANIVSLNKDFLSGHADVGIEITPPDADPETALALGSNTPFTKEVQLGKIAAHAQAGTQDIPFGEGAGKVSFSASAGGFAGLGVYFDTKKMLDTLALDDSIAPGMDLKDDPINVYYTVLQWGYDLTASAKGSVALGAPGAITFGADAKRDAAYAVVRRFDKTTGAMTAVAGTAKSWMLPSQVSSLDSLAPGTWLIAEVDGSIGLKLGVQYGYDFNWVHEAKLAGLSGDIGLRLKLGVSASVGFNASGKYAVVLSRDPKDANDKSIRFRLFKQRQHGWSAALDAGATAQADVSKFLPAFDDFVKAVFGVHAAQILTDLETWTDPNTKLSTLLAGVSEKYAGQLLKDVTGIDPTTAEAAFNAAKDKVLGLINKWKSLDHDLATTLWKLLENKTDPNAIAKITSIANQIATANQDTVKNLLNQELKNVTFFASPVGKWLEAAAVKGIASAMTNSAEFAELQKAAQLTGEILDGSLIQDVLSKLQAYINEHLDLKQLEGVVDQASFDKLDEWLKARISAFLDHEFKLEELDNVRKTIHLVLGKGEDFYNKAVAALNHKYDFHFTYTYSSTTTNTALLDIVFDFGADAAAMDGVKAALKEALGGQYDQLLTQETQGVTLNVATLTHQIERHSHVEISMPFFNKTVDDITSSVAKVNAVADDGRLLVYDLDSSNIIIEKNKWNSHLTVGAHFPVAKVRNHREGETPDPAKNELSYSYSLRQIKKDTRRADLQFQLGPYVANYLQKALPADKTLGDWIDGLQTFVDDAEPELRGTDKLGPTLTSLELSLAGTLGAAWLKAKDATDDNYRNMSLRLQTKIREIVTAYYFQNLDHFDDLDVMEPLLVYAAIPPMNNVNFHWDFQDPDLRRSVMKADQTKAGLAFNLQAIFPVLKAHGVGSAGNYNPSDAGGMQNRVSKIDGIGDIHIKNLLIAEVGIISGAISAAKAIAKFLNTAPDKPSQAITALADFGANIVTSFNAGIGSEYGGDALRPLGTALFVEAAKSLDPTVNPVVSGIMRLVVLKLNAAPPDFLNGVSAKQEDILTQQLLVSL